MSLDLRSLLRGPQVIVEHDENHTGQFQYLTGPIALAPLVFFSETIQRQAQKFGGDTELLPQKAPILLSTPIQISGSTSNAHTDMIDWMFACCNNDSLLSIHQYLPQATITTLVLTMTSIRILGVTKLQQDVDNFIARLTNEVVPIDELEQIITLPKDAILSELYDPIISTVAGAFGTGILPQVKRYFQLATTYKRFEEEVLSSLRQQFEHQPSWERAGLWFIQAAWMTKHPDDFTDLRAASQSDRCSIEIPFLMQPQMLRTPGPLASMSANNSNFA